MICYFIAYSTVYNVLLVMGNDNSVEDNMNDNTIDIHSETFDKDFDEVSWDPEVIDDSDEEAAELYGLNN